VLASPSSSSSPSSGLALRLQNNDVDAFLDLYDRTADSVYAYALRITRSKRKAYAATRRGFLSVWAEPGLLKDSAVPYELQMAVITERALYPRRRS
jgi:hypothetical protein